MHYHIEHCAIIVLAAGMSSRLGQPKQLIHFQNKNLLQHAIDEACQTGLHPVLVVVGAHENLVLHDLKATKVSVIKNVNWEEGISSSIRCGLIALLEMNAATDGVIFMVCDQPHVTVFLLESLLKEQQKSGLPIVASRYENTLGTPVLFHKSFFTQLMQLIGDTGARKLIKQNMQMTSSIPFPKGGIDIDTLEDYRKLQDSNTG